MEPEISIYEQTINNKISSVRCNIDVSNINRYKGLADLDLVYYCINSDTYCINFRKQLNILKKNKKSVELFLNLNVLMMYRAYKALKFRFRDKDKINMDKLKFIPYGFLQKFILRLYNFLNNEFIGNTCSYDDYFMESREVGIWMNFN